MNKVLTLLPIYIYFYSSSVLALTSIQQFEQDKSRWKVLVYLSASCPCSKSHVQHLNQLFELFGSQASFYGVTTDSFQKNANTIKDYYEKGTFQFPIIKDSDQSLVKKYKALKTPHVVILGKDQQGYKALYTGGISNAREFTNSSKKYLSENLVALTKNKKLPYQRGQSLGCYIKRF